ncbi:MAG: hypothetical protein K2W85_14925 [Phycisphaerales bacterium]|nr:hypothetical protein [Phycisphaerales bacterium]
MPRWTIARKIMIMTIVMWFAPLLAAGIVLLILHRTFPLWPYLAALAAVVPLAGSAWWQYRTRQRLNTLVPMDWSACLYCFQDLRGIGMRGTCPECGQPFDLYQTRAKWRDTVSDLVRDDSPD